MNIPLIVLAAAAAMMAVERVRPGRVLPHAPGFVVRAVALNGVQAASVYAIGDRFDAWWSALSPWDARGLGTILGATLGYLAITFVYYWWHRARHEVDWLWRGVHQLHHSPARLEILTSFYKHPLEIGLNALLSSAVLFGVVGLGPEAAAITVLLTGLAELVYHWNVRTPRWLGWLFQRPEMHCVHHERERHTNNYSDLPLWDLLFGTFENPETFDGACGFAQHREAKLGAMLRGKDVNDPTTGEGGWVAPAVLLLGLGRMVADPADLPELNGVLAATGASPAPKVFTAHESHEPFATAMTLTWTDIEGHARSMSLRPDGPRMRGAYNRRNAYGAVVVFLPHGRGIPMLQPMFDEVAAYALCGDRPLLAEMGIDPRSVSGDVTIVYTPPPRAPTLDPATVVCSPEARHA